MSLKPVSTDYVSPSLDRITSLLKNLRTLNSSSAVLIARYPDVITCLRLRAPTQDVFVLFNPRVSSEDEQVASLTFCISLQEIAQRLCDVFPQFSTVKHSCSKNAPDTCLFPGPLITTMGRNPLLCPV
ncbi:hypothetical protein L210DRAFT_3565071 [Boletus edulis BED1]|uniref:Uncharacterized protein n=1 Tax=Boletus edulis BED1 TaxID=1328754 RepID=A0AAD4BFL2_BOLED|nr:hypothetical protein L210DRAFT_3565071 [Boletus edulis BED1]